MRTESAVIVPTPPINILMVDDNAADQRLVEEALTTVAPCVFVRLRDTHEAFEYIDGGRRADLIVVTLDSESKGLEFVQSLKNDDERQHIPLAVFASGAGPDEAKVVQSSGAFYLQKPLDFDGHVRLASKLLSLARA